MRRVELEAVAEDPRAARKLHQRCMAEVVADKGYHSNEVLVDLRAPHIRSHVSEPGRGRRKWKNKADAQVAFHGNFSSHPKSPWPTSTEAPRRDRRTGVCPRITTPVVCGVCICEDEATSSSVC